MILGFQMSAEIDISFCFIFCFGWNPLTQPDAIL